jgi:uncharacterized membrane protein YtjA (UPF0391 family)
MPTIWNIFPAAASSQAKAKDDAMLKWALIFLVISIIAGFFGFSGVSAATATIARVLFGIALVIFLIFLVLALMAGQAVLEVAASSIWQAAGLKPRLSLSTRPFDGSGAGPRLL